MAVRLATIVCLVVAASAVVAQGAGRAPDVATARRSLAELNAQESSLALRFGRNRGEVARLLGALQLFGRDPPPALLVDPRDAKDAVRAAILIRSIAPPLEARARAMAAEAQALAQVRRRVAAASGDLFAAESALLDKRGRLDGVVSDAASLAPPSRRPLTDSLDRQPPPRLVLAPTAGPIQTGFGGRLSDGGRSQGVAIRAAPGAAVLSPAAAVVDYAGPLNGWGQVLILRGAGGCHMVLSGLGKVSVAIGQTLAAGQVIGAMATQSPAELYFEVRMEGRPVDPARLMVGPSRKIAAD